MREGMWFVQGMAGKQSACQANTCTGDGRLCQDIVGLVEQLHRIDDTGSDWLTQPQVFRAEEQGT